MEKGEYFFPATKINVHNKRTEALSKILKGFFYTTVSFDEQLTPQTLLEWFDERVREINLRLSWGRDITVKMVRFECLHYVFADGATVAFVTLHKVRARCGKPEDLDELLR